MNESEKENGIYGGQMESSSIQVASSAPRRGEGTSQSYTTLPTGCGHATDHAIRIRLKNGWTTFCIGCWRSKRRSLRSQEDRCRPDFAIDGGHGSLESRTEATRSKSSARRAAPAGALRCLVTGVAGFIGSHLAERLLAEGCEVAGIDCLTDYYSAEIKNRNLRGMLSNPRFRWVREDLNDVPLPALLRDVDWVFHLAGQPGVRGSWGAGFAPYVRNNIEATQRLLEAVRTSGVKKFVYASSSSVYGRTAPPMAETNLTRPHSPYGVTKLTAENLCLLYAQNFSLPITAVRYFTVFGPRQRPDMAFSRFLVALLENSEIPIYGDGMQTRDFTYVSDAVEGTLLAARYGAPGEVYNLGGGCPAALIDAIRAMERATGRTGRLSYTPMKNGDVVDTLADTTKARTVLGYFPAVSMEEGIQRQADWVEQQSSVPVISPVRSTAPPRIAWPRRAMERSEVLPIERPRVLLYSHDTYGLGHLRRNLAIADHLLSRRDADFSVMLLTGSPVASSWPLPARLKVRSLPAVVKVDAEQYASRDGCASFEAVRIQREKLILDAVRAYRPHVFLVDHAPAGMKGELLRSLRYIRDNMPLVRTVLGLRDILDDPQTVQKLWKDQGIYELLEQYYDQVLVYGSRRLFDPVREYKIPKSVESKTLFCGYIARARGGFPAYSCDYPQDGLDGRLVLVTAGGGGDGYPLMDGYLRALRGIEPGTIESLLVPGPLMAAEQRQALERAAADRPDVKVVHTTELEAFIWRADLVVSMSGYNTTAEILAARKPAILVPRAAPRAEQRLRATLLSKLRLAQVVQPEEDLVARLAELLKASLADNGLPGGDWNAVDLGGVHRVGNALVDLLASSAESEQAPYSVETASAVGVGI